MRDITQNNSEKKETGRVPFIDVARGMAIVLLIVGHAIGLMEHPLNRFILSFHMPLFMAISGICFPVSSRINLYGGGGYLVRKLKSLGWPYLKLSMLGLLLYWTILVPLGKDREGIDILNSIIGVMWSDHVIGRTAVNGFWFVYDLLFISIIYAFLMNLVRWKGLVVVIAMGVSYFMWRTQVNFYYAELIQRQSFGLLFFSLGALFCGFRNRIVEIIGRYRHWICMGVVVLVLIVAIGSKINAPVLMAENKYGNYWLFIITASGGSMAVVSVAVLMTNRTLLRWMQSIGRDSILYLFFHFWLLYAYHFVVVHLFPSAKWDEYQWWISGSILALLFCGLMAQLIRRHFFWLIRGWDQQT